MQGIVARTGFADGGCEQGWVKLRYERECRRCCIWLRVHFPTTLTPSPNRFATVTHPQAYEHEVNPNSAWCEYNATCIPHLDGVRQAQQLGEAHEAEQQHALGEARAWVVEGVNMRVGGSCKGNAKPISIPPPLWLRSNVAVPYQALRVPNAQ